MLTTRHSSSTPPPPTAVPTQVLKGLTATEQQMKSTHVIYRQRFLLKNNCGDRGWTQGSMAMDFSVVGSCIVGHNERWRRGRRRGEEWMRDCGCFSVWEKMSDQVLSNDSRGWTCMNKEQFLFASQASEVQHEHRTICQSENRLFCMTYFCSCVSVSGLLTDLWWAGPSHQRPFSSSYMQQTRFGCI